VSDVDSIQHFAVVNCLGFDRARLHLRGELDIAATGHFAEAFEQAFDGGNRSLILIDLSDLTYCDSSGIRALLIAAGKCRNFGVRFRVVGARGAVLRVIELTDTVDILNLDPDG